jgi:hypothetical protein
MWWIYFVSIYENRRMKTVESVLRRMEGRKKDYVGGGKSN